MLGVSLCLLLTVLPDYLYRRYVQGKRFGKEITLYSVWYELRYWHNNLPVVDCFTHNADFLLPSVGICSVVSLYRTVPILPESSGSR